MPEQHEGFQLLKTKSTIERVMDQTYKRSVLFKKDFEKQEQNLLNEIEKMKADIIAAEKTNK